MNKCREGFEAEYPTPEYMKFNEATNSYVFSHDIMRSRTGESNRNRLWKAWQSAWKAALSHAEGEAVTEVTTEPDYWSRGHFYEGRKKDIKIIKGLEDIPVGTKLYTHPAPQVAGWRSGYPEYDGDGGVCHIPLDGHPDFIVVAFNRDGTLVDSCGDDVGYSLEDVEQWKPIDAHPAPDEREIARPGYAGVTVWIGDQQCTQVVDRTVLETSRADELLRHFENAQHLLRAGKEDG